MGLCKPGIKPEVNEPTEWQFHMPNGKAFHKILGEYGVKAPCKVDLCFLIVCLMCYLNENHSQMRHFRHGLGYTISLSNYVLENRKTVFYWMSVNDYNALKCKRSQNRYFSSEFWERARGRKGSVTTRYH